MAIGDITEARLNGDRFAESSLGHPAELWAPPLVPTVGAPSSGDNLLRRDALGPVTEAAFRLLAENTIHRANICMGWRTCRIVPDVSAAANTSAGGE
jgi:hypothetical protein